MKALRYVNLLVVILLLASFLGIQPAAAKPVVKSVLSPDALYVPGEVLIAFAKGQSATAYKAQASALAGTVEAQVVDQYANMALLSFNEEADIPALVTLLGSQEGVLVAQPNYIYSIPEVIIPDSTPASPKFIIRHDKTTGKDYSVSIDTLKALRSTRNGRITATYPTDKLLWENFAWTRTGADMVWTNTTPSKTICEIDTGVDNLHPDLSGQILLGPDFVNNDALPMDDNGHGTHVAGIMVAKQNNAVGIAGIAPNAKVVAVKVLSAQGFGTNFDIASAITYCANRTDVKIINLSLGGAYSPLLEIAVDYATNDKGKLIVATAGNDNLASYCGYWDDNGTPADTSDDTWVNQGDDRSYPAGFSIAANNYSPSDCTVNLGTQKHPAYPGVISVGATGDWVDYGDYWSYDSWLKAPYSNYGPWVTFLAPGTDILSTTPYDKPFDMQFNGGMPPRYGYLSGTSMAAPVVSAAFARGWGYRATIPPITPPPTPLQVKQWVFDHSDWGGSSIDNWPDYPVYGQVYPTPQVNIAYTLMRGSVFAMAVDATTGLPLVGASFSVWQGTVQKGISTITSSQCNAPGGTALCPNAWTEIINLPGGEWLGDQIYVPKINKAGYTAASTNAFVGSWESDVNGRVSVLSGWYTSAGTAAVPPRNVNFTAVPTWSTENDDLDIIVYLPAFPKPWNDGQPSIFSVSMAWSRDGLIYGLDPDGTGSLGVFPYARQMYESANSWWNWEATVIRNRFMSLGAGFAANAALPYYTGTYEVWMTDYGQYYDINDNQTEDSNEPPLLADYDYDNRDYNSKYLTMFIWKDGAIKYWVDLGDFFETCGYREHMWHALDISSGPTGTVTYTPVDDCATAASIPSGYTVPTFPNLPIPVAP